MSKLETLDRVRKLGLLAVLRGPSPKLTLQMVEALVAGGVLGLEITYSTPEATRVVKELHDKYGDEILWGMGTLTHPGQVDQAKQAGANYIVSPHYEAELAQAMAASGLGVMIGALSPSEVVQAYRIGSDIIKIFPGSLGGPAYMKALRGPFPEIPMMPTGGISPENIVDWFAAGAAAVGAGSQLCPTDWAKEGRFADITQRAREFVQAVEQARQAV